MSKHHEKGLEHEIVWIVGVALAVLVAAWFFWHEQIARFWMAVRAFEAKLILFDSTGRAALERWLATSHPRDVSFAGILQSANVAGWSLRWYVVVILTIMFGYLIYRSPERGSRYAKTHTMQSLAKQEAARWPVITPMLEGNFIDIPLDDRVNGMRQRGRDYARRHKMIVLAAALPDDVDHSQVEALDGRSVLLLDRTRLVFSKQLGELWQGVPTLRPYERALFGAFAAQMSNDRDLAFAIINDLAVAYTRAKTANNAELITTLRAQKALHQYGNTPAVGKLVARHAYKRTVLMSMLAAARENGVLPAAWFRWLKTVDRVTWYALSDLGMDVSSVEAGGVRCHWQSERVAKTPLVHPMIEEAVVGLKEYLGEILDDEIPTD